MGPPSMLLALMMASALPNFRDVSLESRCEALAKFVTSFATGTLKDKSYQPGSCGEGNGVGGALYTFDFQAGTKADAHRLTIAWDQDGPVKVSVRPAIDPLEQAVAQWAGRKPAVLQIYGKPYDDFVKGILAYHGDFPTFRGDQPATISFKLIPGKDLRAGAVKFEAADGDFLKCFQCPDIKCLNTEVHYQFQDRFFALRRQTSEHFGVGWIVNGPTPISPDGSTWKFVCGVSRYSLENVAL